MKVRSLVLTACLVSIGLLVWRAIPVRVEAVPVTRGDIVQSLVLTGRVRPAARPLLGFTVAGTVSEVLVREGDRVRDGQLLVRLDDAQALAAVAEAREGLSAVRAGALADAERSRLALHLAERDHARATRLYEAGAVSRQAMEQAAQREAEARAVWETASAGAAGGQSALASIARARATLDAAEARLALTRLRAPGAATVIVRRTEPGDAVTPGQILVEVALDGPTELVVSASEEMLGGLRVGATGLASADAFPAEQFAVRVAWIAPAVDPARGTIEARLDVPDPPAYLLPDMTVSVNIDAGRRTGALLLPRRVVRLAGPDSTWVMVESRGRAVRVRVRPGIAADDAVEVLDGLGEGAVVLPQEVHEGARVRPVR